MYRYKVKALRPCLILCLFNKIVVCSPLVPKVYVATGSFFSSNVPWVGGNLNGGRN